MSLFKDIVRKSKSIVKDWLRQDVYYQPQTIRQVTFVGGRPDSGYGGWGICAEDLTSQSIVYSVGVGDDISFDLDLIQRYGVKIYAFDPTPESHEWLKKQHVPKQFVLFPYGIADYDGTAKFFPHINKDWVAHSMVRHAHAAKESIDVPVFRLDTMMKKLGHARIDLLKMDIEGGEYAVLDGLAVSGIGVNQLLVEFHHRFDQLSPAMTKRTIKGLNAMGLEIFHISERGEEYSFIRN